MTSKERERLRAAVRLFMADDDTGWEAAMEILCSLAGMETAIQRLPKDIPRVPPWELPPKKK